MARNTEKCEKLKHKLKDQEYGEETNRWKTRHKTVGSEYSEEQ
jgi:hypothetical protein